MIKPNPKTKPRAKSVVKTKSTPVQATDVFPYGIVKDGEHGGRFRYRNFLYDSLADAESEAKRYSFTYSESIMVPRGALVAFGGDRYPGDRVQYMHPKDNPYRQPKDIKKKILPVRTPAELADAQMICPHCQTKGFVTTSMVSNKVGVSGGKLTAALLTGGLSLLAVGLSRTQTCTQARCRKCNAVWHF